MSVDPVDGGMPACSHTNLIVTYNSRADVGDLLADLRAHAPTSPTIVIDNASPDGTADFVESAFPAVQLVRNATNLGYARAVNQGFKLASTPFVFLLNPDIRIGSRDVIGMLCACLEEEPGVAAAGPLQFKADGPRPRVNFTWSYWTPRAFRLYLGYLFGQPPRSVEPIPVSFLNAGCLLLRRDAFEAIGRLNEKYFLYGEEPDLFLKLMRHGYECRLVPGAHVVHAREQSLRSVSSLRRIRFKFSGLANIADAVVRGVANILIDRLERRVPR